jgi:hypothetical protein
VLSHIGCDGWRTDVGVYNEPSVLRKGTSDLTGTLLSSVLSRARDCQASVRPGMEQQTHVMI